MIASPSKVTLIGILLHGRSSTKFILGVIFSFAFSIAVILGTVGIMDGFDDALKKGLKQASGDFLIYNVYGSFNFEKSLQPLLLEAGVKESTAILQTEGFIVHGESSKGIVVKGVVPQSFSLVTGLNVQLAADEIILGKELQKQLEVKNGDQVVLIFARGEESPSSLPFLKSFKVKDSIEHGIYKKDLRFAYVLRKSLQNILGLGDRGDRVNLVSVNLAREASGESIEVSSPKYLEKIKEFEEKWSPLFSKNSYVLRAFWKEFDPLIEAVQVEKLTIGLILQLVVVISIFNVLSFIIYLNEKRSQEIFLLQALGVSKKQLFRVWLILVIMIWAASCLLSIGLAQVFNYGLQNLSVFQLPGEIYNLGKLSLKLGLTDYLVVFVLALFWIFVIAMLGMFKLKRKTILSGLRKEFS